MVASAGDEGSKASIRRSAGRQTVLIGFADALAAPEVVFSLHDAGFDVAAFGRSGAPRPSIARLPIVRLLSLPAPELDAVATIAALQMAVAELAPAAILPLDDAALWLVDQAFGSEEQDSKPAMAGAVDRCAEIALSKTDQILLAREAGFTVPPTRVAHDRSDILSHAEFPAIVKPALAAELQEGNRLGRGQAHYLMSAADLDNLPADEQLSYPALIQPLIAGQGEGIFGFAGVDGIVNWSGHRRIRMMNPHGSGASACQLKEIEPELKAAATRMMTGMGWRGPFMIELLRDHEGTAYFMELNGRLWGSTALGRRAGLEYSAWAVAQALSSEFMPPTVTLRDPGTVRHLGRELLHLVFVLRGPKSEFHRKDWPRFWPAVGAVIRPSSRRQFYNWHPEHSWFPVRDALITIRNFVSRKR